MYLVLQLIMKMWFVGDCQRSKCDYFAAHFLSLENFCADMSFNRLFTEHANIIHFYISKSFTPYFHSYEIINHCQNCHIHKRPTKGQRFWRWFMWWLQYIVFKFRIEYGLVFLNNAFWWIKALHDVKFKEFFKKLYKLFAMLCYSDLVSLVFTLLKVNIFYFHYVFIPIGAFFQ